MATIQLIGCEQILAAFEKIGAEYWALFEGSKPLLTGSGAANLEEWLQMFLPSGSKGTYILRIYRDPEMEDCVASFNCKLSDIYEGAGIAGYGSRVDARLAAIEKKMEGVGANDSMEEETFADVIMGWLRDPVQLGQVIGAVNMLFGKGSTSVIQPTTIGATEPPNQQDIERLAAILDRLHAKDPKLVEHLNKLATLAETKPDTFKFLISNLDAL